MAAPGVSASAITAAEALLAGRARVVIEQEGAEWCGCSMGLAWFTDRQTGSTLAMPLREAMHVELVQQHLLEARKEFWGDNT